MRLVDFLIRLLETQSATLRRLAALLGEEELLQLLEIAGETADTPPEFELDPKWFASPRSTDETSAYAFLEGTVREFQLSAVLEFHLWAYPFYRFLIESPIDLRSPIHTQNTLVGETLVSEAMAQAKGWVRKLPLPPELSRQAEQASLVPWLRFRSEVLKQLGKSPFEAINR